MKNNSNESQKVRNDEELPKGTIIKIGDSIITGIMKEKNPRKMHNVNKRPYP